jgi:hypothetical protein
MAPLGMILKQNRFTSTRESCVAMLEGVRYASRVACMASRLPHIIESLACNRVG